MNVLLLMAIVGATCNSPNFTVSSPSSAMARKAAITAEQCRHDQAVFWFGKPLPNWPVRARVQVTHGDNGGMSRFTFPGPTDLNGDWSGDTKRLYDSVIPHEVNHFVFATYYNRWLPRWISEGAANVVEHQSEKDRWNILAIQRVRNRRAMSFNTLLKKSDYRGDFWGLYAQGSTAVNLMVLEAGPRTFTEFITSCYETGNYNAALVQHYPQHPSVSSLEHHWAEWLLAGAPVHEYRLGTTCRFRRGRGWSCGADGGGNDVDIDIGPVVKQPALNDGPPPLSQSAAVAPVRRGGAAGGGSALSELEARIKALEEASILIIFEKGDESDEVERTIRLPLVNGTLRIPPQTLRMRTVDKDGRPLGPSLVDTAPLGMPLKVRNRSVK